MLNFQAIRWKYPRNVGSGFTLIPKSSIANQDSDQYFLELATRLKNFDVIINHDLPHLLRGYLKERLHKAQKLQIRMIRKYMNEIERISKLYTNTPNNLANQKLRNELQLELNNILNELSQYLKDLEPKARFINHLKTQYFHYCNIAEYDLDIINIIQFLERNFIKDNPHVRILCSNDILNNNNKSKLNRLCSELATERLTNRKLRIIYADFSYCSFVLSDMLILSSKNKQIPYEPLTKRLTSSSSSVRSDEDVINILLIGETGVGKSTFINAFVNYLTFNTLQQAASNQPVALIPVSFLITTGNNFQEHTVKFGNFDNLINEDFDHPGQSVTQYCRSYLFALNHIIGKKLRIIDTPGFGDTRGLDQDNINMQHILEYICNLTHLDAICFLLKPNTSRLHIFFRTCLIQLFDLLGSNARQNMIFCFTNARSTFYKPGNTAPLLRTMLNSLSINDIPFKKENTFCFDNESFRYLVALKNGIQFNDEENKEYEISWSTSVNESNRLINYICTQLSPFSLSNGWQSIKHAQIEIIQMIRPILETMRNILRNKILWKMDSPNKSIELYPQVISHSSMLCTVCKRDPFQLDNFWILPDQVHDFRNACLVCSCTQNQHISIDYMLIYKILNNSSNYQENEMNDLLNRLNIASVEFAYFLINVAHSTTEDPFLVGLLRMIDEEKQICVEKTTNHLNLELVKELEKLIGTYKEQMNQQQQQQQQNNLEDIYEKIKTVSGYPIIHEQIEAIRQKRKIHKNEQQQHEFQVSENAFHGKIYLSTPC
ncbi:unnamed protein product [Rotaria sordida]|uniref:G domain-containing protein n=1 Tax=Rotaria sordida TaxID=392033 RepID=A0A815DLF3_9BILA|nr:unnamed protein product [Rotaria sordida]CAF1298956.1 unnamed protein product [Rotaria sordida]CAF3772667.1 unnamed protein product [Rotaria sordida]